MMDTRAQSIGLARFILSLIAAAPIVWIVWETTGRILPGAKNATNNSSANQATVWIQDGIDWLPLAFLLISFIGIVVLAIFQREVLR
ncbi:hypothetical protein [Haloarcula onubensis]|uniref:Uncharacterized protein n=1 Tax=Haloarcula onubensis TaxID=2950539 RepID=A0ABU2FVG0_9EURY|nr:hypothetical protein [Halomicroarcula sp. S3CR25-11]MDS0284760.1 hypothetical protein [Halomicroarcula sp. S3CR25-11]